jgi:hypothetical protein
MDLKTYRQVFLLLYSSPFNFWFKGKKTNLTHPGIAALCIDFYYGSAGGKVPLAKLFPNDFSTIIPEHAVVVAMTCVSNYRCFLLRPTLKSPDL